MSEFKRRFTGNRVGEFTDIGTGEITKERLASTKTILQPHFLQKSIEPQAMQIEDTLTDREYRLYGALDYFLRVNSTEIVLRDPDWEYLKQLLKVADYTLEATFRGLVKKDVLIKLRGTRHWMMNPRLKWMGLQEERDAAFTEWCNLKEVNKLKPKRGRPKKHSEV